MTGIIFESIETSTNPSYVEPANNSEWTAKSAVERDVIAAMMVLCSPAEPTPRHTNGSNGDVHAAEVLRRARSMSERIVSDKTGRGEATLARVSNEMCHVCHHRKVSGLTFHCGRHTYCDYHCAVSGGVFPIVFRTPLSFVPDLKFPLHPYLFPSDAAWFSLQ